MPSNKKSDTATPDLLFRRGSLLRLHKYGDSPTKINS